MPVHHVYLGLGSNVEQEIHLATALEMLEEHITCLRGSPVYESVSTDPRQSPFYNLVVGGSTDLSLTEFQAWIKEIELIHGRVRSTQRFIPLDIDILLFDDLMGIHEGIELPRAEILDRAFVLYPLQQLAPHLKHPTIGISFSELWRQLQPGPPLSLVLPSLGASSSGPAIQTNRFQRTGDSCQPSAHEVTLSTIHEH
ncbi:MULTISPECIES: 2-amino-4-hydroxy-6-hydroxymethyldihydropteridine diphosphokinase [Pseudomonas]|uniref:2-amino-4-hydroxy-6-hydroxymethyldihydropteridine diphosphokinase n=1 Tax=Pseudomonas urmiensis TaxID=2745493 RepID=A0A923FX62_9PSED|nr:2-amino-4-hydroxy-6-hydroxymethyldihydropteridine diphosphokinase [Pseudomonas urmiensis]MBV4535673.1 2-amino-4-hydroxy-6-hydroxymethyldihydropteridine diphosphokinase [Pseudomonas urmiensis]HEN8731786.1 2-amino-4-hydroxy-6-hydroxymethyldihydropteridine diphosphokinase [Pseudomonas putida]